MPDLRRSGCAGALSLLLGSVACSSGPVGPETGTLSGSVTVVGDLLPGGNGTGEIYLLRTPDTRRSDALRREPLQGGPRTYSFSFAALEPGTYYLEACLHLAGGMGCAPYSTDAAGNATAVRVRRGQTTAARIRF
jgi:hypothetical protein